MSVGLLEFGAAPLSLLELVFESNDAACCAKAGALIDQLPTPRGQTQLGAGVAAVAAG